MVITNNVMAIHDKFYHNKLKCLQCNHTQQEAILRFNMTGNSYSMHYMCESCNHRFRIRKNKNGIYFVEKLRNVRKIKIAI